MKEDLRHFCREHGADLVGIADLAHFHGTLPVVPENLLEGFSCAVSIGIAIDGRTVSEIENRPTPAYAEMCRSINRKLDATASSVAQWISAQGFRATPIPASRMVDDPGLLGNISHKAVARMAGLGWQGKSLLLVTPEFGPRVRLATVLTDMPLISDQPLENRCGACSECSRACPASAIRNVPTADHYGTREEAVVLSRCHAQLLEFKQLPGIGYTFCGVCIRACPFGKTRGAPVQKH